MYVGVNIWYEGWLVSAGHWTHFRLGIFESLYISVQISIHTSQKEIVKKIIASLMVLECEAK